MQPRTFASVRTVTHTALQVGSAILTERQIALPQGEGCRLEFSGFSPFKSRMMNHRESPKPRAFVKIDGKTKMAQLRQQSLEVMARLKEGVEAAPEAARGYPPNALSHQCVRHGKILSQLHSSVNG